MDFAWISSQKIGGGFLREGESPIFLMRRADDCTQAKSNITQTSFAKNELLCLWSAEKRSLPTTSL